MNPEWSITTWNEKLMSVFCGMIVGKKFGYSIQAAGGSMLSQHNPPQYVHCIYFSWHVAFCLSYDPFIGKLLTLSNNNPSIFSLAFQVALCWRIWNQGILKTKNRKVITMWVLHLNIVCCKMCITRLKEALFWLNVSTISTKCRT